MSEQKIQIGQRVESGEGEDRDSGRVMAYINPPQGECDVMVAWDSGVRTPAALGRKRTDHVESSE